MRIKSDSETMRKNILDHLAEEQRLRKSLGTMSPGREVRLNPGDGRPLEIITALFSKGSRKPIGLKV